MTRVAAGALALLIYCFGLIAPLTPSEGHPSILEVVLFVGLPVGGLLSLAFTSTTTLGQLLGSVASVAIVALSAYVLSIQL